jgi:hypothetical protein
VLSGEVYEGTADLGTRLADGIEAVAQKARLSSRAHRLFPRSGYAHGVQLPHNVEAVRQGLRRDVTDLQRVYFANRGCGRQSTRRARALALLRPRKTSTSTWRSSRRS